jgi:gas vesicle protein
MNNERIYYSREAEIQAIREIAKLMVFCVTLGLGIGAIIALLFSPQSGQKNRDNLGKAVEQGLNNGREILEPVVKQVEKELNGLQKTVEQRLK